MNVNNKTDHRTEAMNAFLKTAGWAGAKQIRLPGDASTRGYVRLVQDGHSAMLLDQPQTAETPAAPVHASEAERRALGYHAMARHAGADTARFVAVANFLRARGLSAPQIYADDPALGFVLSEDLGESLYADVLTTGASETELYGTAIDALAKLHAETAMATISDNIPLYAYDDVALIAETDLITEWFLPHALGRPARMDEIAEHRDLWRATLRPVLESPAFFVHRDYHAQNLLWLPSRAGIAKVGIIDFQDAVAGARSYDLISLIEDARRDVPPALAESMIARYLDTMRNQGAPLNEDTARAEMAVMAAQRNVKIAGIFARLAKRDNKPRYLAYLPRVWNNLNRDLEHPALASLKTWYDRIIPIDARGAALHKGASV
jgi:aminoglycoside/choline kinase family phosphotransferase